MAFFQTETLITLLQPLGFNFESDNYQNNLLNSECKIRCPYVARI